jgi:large subunit ribosomal protein L22
MEIIARAKYIRMSSKKIRLVAGLIRGLAVDKASWQLQFNKKIASKALLKVLESAIANAKNNFGLEADNLRVKSVAINDGPVLKRWMPRAQGRATPLRRPTAHVKLVLEEIVASGKAKPSKKVDNSDIIKVGTGEFDEIKDVAKSSETKEVKGTKTEKKAAAPKKGFAAKVLNRKTGSK